MHCNDRRYFENEFKVSIKYHRDKEGKLNLHHHNHTHHDDQCRIFLVVGTYIITITSSTGSISYIMSSISFLLTIGTTATTIISSSSNSIIPSTMSSIVFIFSVTCTCRYILLIGSLKCWLDKPSVCMFVVIVNFKIIC